MEQDHLLQAIAHVLPPRRRDLLRRLKARHDNLGEVLRNYEKVLIPELNKGQLKLLIRSEFLVDAVGLNKVQGKPFSVREVVFKIHEMLA